MNFNRKKAFIWLFSILYLCVAFVSTFHAIAFFGLANNIYLSVILALTFEVGQATVLLSILTKKKGTTKVMPWVLMGILTLVQVLGNVFSSYKYLMTYAKDNLVYFKDPVFMWTDLPDQQCNVILSYIIGAILPVVALCMTDMFASVLTEDEEEVEVKEEKEIEVPQEQPKLENVIESFSDTKEEPQKEETTEEPSYETNEEKTGFVNL